MGFLIHRHGAFGEIIVRSVGGAVGRGGLYDGSAFLQRRYRAVIVDFCHARIAGTPYNITTRFDRADGCVQRNGFISRKQFQGGLIQRHARDVEYSCHANGGRTKDVLVFIPHGTGIRTDRYEPFPYGQGEFSAAVGNASAAAADASAYHVVFDVFGFALRNNFTAVYGDVAAVATPVYIVATRAADTRGGLVADRRYDAAVNSNRTCVTGTAAAADTRAIACAGSRNGTAVYGKAAVAVYTDTCAVVAAGRRDDTAVDGNVFAGDAGAARTGSGDRAAVDGDRATGDARAGQFAHRSLVIGLYVNSQTAVPIEVEIACSQGNVIANNEAHVADESDVANICIGFCNVPGCLTVLTPSVCVGNNRI